MTAIVNNPREISKADKCIPPKWLKTEGEDSSDEDDDKQIEEEKVEVEDP